MPNVLKAAVDCQRFGAHGITVHPRPDERHIRYADVREIKKNITTEFNIEGNPREKKFVELVLETKPTQVTLVPDAQAQLTSDHGWDTIQNRDYLKEMISVFKKAGIRTSIFVDADLKMVEGAKATGTDRVELYTESFAKNFSSDKHMAVKPFTEAARLAGEIGLGLNAGHDINLENLKFFSDNVPGLLEVSVGHAIISDSIYFGLENTIRLYLRQLS